MGSLRCWSMKTENVTPKANNVQPVDLDLEICQEDNAQMLIAQVKGIFCFVITSFYGTLSV